MNVMNMDMIIRVLGGVLGVQILLAAITWWPSGSGSSDTRDLVATDAAKLDKIAIYGRVLEGEVHDDPLVLERKSGEWVITSAFDYPADEDNLKPVFEAIDKLVVTDAVATQAYSHGAMDVSDDEHSRKLELTSGEATTTILLGSAQGKAVHVRVAGDNPVYKVRGITPYSIPEHATRIFDRDFQKVDVASVREMTIERPGEAPIRFVYEDGTWDLPDLVPPGKAVDQSGAREFVKSTLNLRMLEPHGRDVTSEMELDARGVKVSWLEEQDDGSSLAAEYYVGADVEGVEGRVYLKSTTTPWVFEALPNQTQHAREKGVEDLFVDPPPEAPAPAPAGGEADGALGEGLELPGLP